MKPIVLAITAAAGSFVFITVLFVIIYQLCSRHRRKSDDHQPHDNVASRSLPPPADRHTESASFDPSIHISISILRLATCNFSKDLVVGDGSFGLVYRAKLPDGRRVAVKKLSSYAFHGLREFAAEMETLGRIQHRNLVRILGYCIYGHDRILVYEFLELGSLDQWLHEPTEERSPSMLTWSARVRIIRGVAAGLQFLHEGCTPCIIHRDIKASNILLDREFDARIADFGLARKIDESKSHVSTQVAGTMGYMPPEYREGMMAATKKADVYSFGVLMLELATGKRPNLAVRMEAGDGTKRDVGLVKWVRLMEEVGSWLEMLDPLMTCNVEKEMLEQVVPYFGVALLCIADMPKQRPCMKEVVGLLRQL